MISLPAAVGSLRAGEIAWQAQAWAAVVSDNFVTSLCACCFKLPADDSGMKIKCSECGIAYYCSEVCKASAAPLHRHECKAAWQIVQMTQGKSDTRGARMLIRVLAHRRLEEEGGHAEPSIYADKESRAQSAWRGARFEDVTRLVSHVDTMTDAKIDSFRNIARGVSKLPVATGLREDEVVNLVAILQCNSQGIVDLNHHRRGDLLIAPADANHSCSPNCFVAFHGANVQFRCIRDIRKGEELTITYTDLYLKRSVRRQKLLDSHCFECCCVRCSDTSASSIDARINGLRCRSSGCNGLVTVEKALCQQCDAKYNPHELQAQVATAHEKFEQAISVYKKRDFTAAREELENFMHTFGNVLCDMHTLTYNALHKLMSVCNALSDAKAGASYARKAIESLQKVYPKYHSELAMMHAALAQTEWKRFTDDGDSNALAAAVHSFDKCLHILAICYGQDHEACKLLLFCYSAAI